MTGCRGRGEECVCVCMGGGGGAGGAPVQDVFPLCNSITWEERSVLRVLPES